MKISPTAIRQKVFETAFRGFEKKEVSSFLEEMAQAMEKINQENLELRSRLQQVESEAKRLKDVEDSLFRTLKTAEDTGAAIISEASEAADQIIAESNEIAEQTTSKALEYADYVRQQADEQVRIIIAAAESKAKETIKEIGQSMQSLLRSYDGLLEQREVLVKSIKRISQDALNQIELSDAHLVRIDAKAYQRAIEELSRSGHFTVANISLLSNQATAVPHTEDEPEEQFEEGMGTGHLEEDTEETITSLQHELEEDGFLEVDEKNQEQEEGSVDQLNQEEKDLAAPESKNEEEEVNQQQIPSRPKADVEPKKSSGGSFFDDID